MIGDVAADGPGLVRVPPAVRSHRRRHPPASPGVARWPVELRDLGAEPLEVPTIEIIDPADGGAALRDAVSARSHEHDWVVLTSANGVNRFCDVLRDGRDLAGVKLAAIGPGTAEALALRQPRRRPRARALRRRVAARGLPAPVGCRRPGAAGPGRGRPRRAPRRAPVARLGGRGRPRLPHRARRGRRPTRAPPSPVPTSSRSPRPAPSSASSTPYGAEAVPPVVACIGPSPPMPPVSTTFASTSWPTSTPSTAWSTPSLPTWRSLRRALLAAVLLGVGGGEVARLAVPRLTR